MNLEFPSPTNYKEKLLWVEGKGFCLGDDLIPVLQYDTLISGWDDELTEFHEGSAGESHPIDVTSRFNAIEALRCYCDKPETILEIGCSSGYLLPILCKEFPNSQIIGSDIIYNPLLKIAEMFPQIPLLQFDLTKSPLPENFSDAVIPLCHNRSRGTLRKVYNGLRGA